MRASHSIRCLACAVSILAATPGLAAEPPASPGAAATAAKGPADTLTRENLTSKLALARQLLAKNSPSMQRIEQSDNAGAKEQVAQANKLLGKAEAELAAGNLEPTAKLLDEIFLLVGTASRTVRDPAAAVTEARNRYNALLEEVHTFQKSYTSLCGRLTEKRCIKTDMDRIGQSVKDAEELARGGKYKEATAMLTEAHAVIVATMNKLMESESIIVYELKFDTPAEEYEHEMGRYHSYDELIPIARAELKPSEQKLQLAERFLQQSRDALDAAKKQAAAGDHAAAIKSLQDGTAKLQSVLRIYGLVVPQ
ncbi:MAG: hypothetical protein QG662_1379 [Pseudomonadota bacterium]|nr:hypothetical protein [Pseudomonadota bacterium]